MSLTIAIIGGGMVGASAALSLAKQGHTIKLIEHKPINAEQCLNEDKIDIRLSALNLFSESFLNQLGAWQHIALSRKARYRRLAAQEQDNAQLIFDAKDIEKDHLGHLIENKVIQGSMWKEFSNFENIDVITDAGRLKRVDNGPLSVDLEFDAFSLQVDLVIAADGAGSITRQLSGIGTTGWQYQQSCMGILIKLDAPQQDITWQQFTPTGPVAFLPMQAPHASLIWYNSSQQLSRLSKLNFTELKKEVIKSFPTLPGDFEIEAQAVFPLTRQHANQYFVNRVVLVGDAAHAINPLAGQGVNLGFKDVAQLVLSIENTDDLVTALKQYQDKRKAANLIMMTAMDACYAGFSNDIAPLKFVRNTLLKGINKLPLVKNNVLKYAIGEYL